MIPLFNLWSRISPDFNSYQYTFFDEVQGLLDSGERPEEVFDWLGYFSEGYATVKLNGKWNFIDKKGKILCDQWYYWADYFNEGFATVELNGKWNFINKKGKTLSRQWFDWIGNFHDGYAKVNLNGKWNFINTKGKTLSRQGFDEVDYFHDDFARVKLNGGWKYLDTNGRLYDYDPRQQNNVLTESKLRKIIRNILLEIYN
jgi:hypothetical protein